MEAKKGVPEALLDLITTNEGSPRRHIWGAGGPLGGRGGYNP